MGKTIKTEVTIKNDRQNIESCDTHWKTSKFIISTFGLPHTEEVIERIAMMIKKYGHHAKLSVYDRYKCYFMDDINPDKGEVSGHMLLTMKEFTNTKIETHDYLKEMDAR